MRTNLYGICFAGYGGLSDAKAAELFNHPEIRNMLTSKTNFDLYAPGGLPIGPTISDGTKSVIVCVLELDDLATRGKKRRGVFAADV